MTSMVPMGLAKWATPEIEIFEPQPPAGSRLAGPAIGWPTGRMAGWLAGWLAGRLLAGWLAGWLAGCWLAGLLTAWLAGFPAPSATCNCE